MTDTRNKSLLQDTAVSHALAKKKKIFPHVSLIRLWRRLLQYFIFIDCSIYGYRPSQLKTETTLGFKGTQRADLENACY